MQWQMPGMHAHGAARCECSARLARRWPPDLSDRACLSGHDSSGITISIDPVRLSFHLHIARPPIGRHCVSNLWHVSAPCFGLQTLGEPSRVIQEMPVAATSQLLQSTHSNATLQEPVPATRRGRPSKQLLLEQELQEESELAQSQRSEASVAVIEAVPAEFLDDIFDARETPLSEAAAAWEDIVEVSLL